MVISERLPVVLMLESVAGAVVGAGVTVVVELLDGLAGRLVVAGENRQSKQ